MFRVCSVRIFGCECWSVLRLACLPQTFCACCRCSLCLLCVLRRALPFLCLLACCHCSLYLFCHFCVAPCLLACVAMNEWGCLCACVRARVFVFAVVRLHVGRWFACWHVSLFSVATFHCSVLPRFIVQCCRVHCSVCFRYVKFICPKHLYCFKHRVLSSFWFQLLQWNPARQRCCRR